MATKEEISKQSDEVRRLYESETGKQWYVVPVCHGEVAFTSWEYQLWLEQRIANSQPSPHRLWEEVPVSELPEKETEKYSIDVPTILDNSLYGWGYYDFENKYWIERGSEGKIVSWLRPLIGNPEVGEK